MSKSKKDKVGGHHYNIVHEAEDLSGWSETWGAYGTRYAKRRHTRWLRRSNKIDKRQLHLEDYAPHEDEISYVEDDWFEAEFENSYFDDPFDDEDPYDDWDYEVYWDYD